MKKNTVVTILVILVAMILMVGNIIGAKEVYGDGTCSECKEGHFHLVGTPNKEHKTYTYECDTCGLSIVSFMRLH